MKTKFIPIEKTWKVIFKTRSKSGFEKFSTFVSAAKSTQARKLAIAKAELEGVSWVRGAQSKIVQI